MNRLTRSLMRAGSRAAIRMYRWSGGRIGGRAVGRTPVLLLTVPGRTSGLPRTVAVGYFEYAGGYVVVGSAAGASADPQWFKNLRAAAEAEVQIGRRVTRVRIRELKGEERDSVWRDVVVARTPAYGRYARPGARRIPLAALTPVV